MGSKMKTKREQEVEKKKEEEEAAARAYEDFYHTFVDVADQKNKVWVKAGTYDAGSRKEDTKDRGKLYKPSSKLDELREKFSSAEKAKEDTSSNGNSAPSKSPFDKPDRPGKKKEKEKKKSNLELFKEELKMIQEERAERHKVKHSLREQNRSTTRFENSESSRGGSLNHLKDASFGEESKSAGGTYDCGDPTTTNIYLANINPNTTEQRLMELFGRFGPLASVKIMWPRTDDERSRGRNCGFVAFMNRKDGERSLNALNGRMVDNFEMKLGWGKCVPIPPHPIYIPPALMELTLPPPPSGLPFNCQPNKKDLQRLPDLNNGLPTDIEGIKEMEQILQRAVVKVVIPTERTLLQLIHRMIEFVIQEGPIFEAMIMNKEIENPNFRFLFDNQSPAHIYYRWKLFSILQGDSQNKWSIKPFRMFANGSIWKPPPVNPFHQGMPEELIKKEEDFDDVNKKGSLSIAQRKRLESMIRSMTAERDSVAEVMMWCIEHAEAAHEICQCLTEALQNVETSFPKKIARLYLVSDILHNCTAKVSNASFFRKYLQDKLVDMFIGLHEAHESMDSRLKAESMKQRVMKCVRAWEDWAVYPHDLLIRLQNIFLGLDVKGNSNTNSASQLEASPYANDTPEPPTVARGDPDIDGVPLDDDGRDVNGASPPLDGVSTTSLLKKSAAISALLGYDDGDDSAEDSADLDGAPIDDDLDGVPIKDSSPKSGGFAPGFVPSKWESVSPKKVEEQAMTLSKWDTLESNRKGDDDQDASDTTPVYDRQAPGTPTHHDNVKKYDVADDEDDIDGVPLDDGVVDFPRRGRHSSRSPDGVRGDGTPSGGGERGSGGRRSRTAYEDDENSSNEDRLQGDHDGKRSKLRAVEIKVLQYQDELERGVRPVKTGYTLSEQVQHYRHKLIKKVSRSEGDSSERRNRRRRSSSSEEKRPKRKTRSPHRSRQRSRTPRRHRSRSPRRRGRSPQSKSPSRKHKKKRH